MDSINLLCRSSIAIVAALSTFVANAGSVAIVERAGKVVVYDTNNTNNPLKVEVKVWAASNETGRDGSGCQLFGSQPLDSTTSNEIDGVYRIKVAEQTPIITITYCAAGYYPRSNYDLRVSDESQFSDPVRMVCTTCQISDARFEKEIVSALNNLAYFRSIDSERFDSVARRVGKGRLGGLSAVIAAWRSRPQTSQGAPRKLMIGERRVTYATTDAATVGNSRVDSSLGATLDEGVDREPARIGATSLQLSEAKIEKEILSELNSLAYFRSIDPARFDSVAKLLGGRRAEGLPAVIIVWRATKPQG